MLNASYKYEELWFINIHNRWNLFHRYNGTRSNDIYYYPNVVAHDSDTTCSIIWMTIVKVIDFVYNYTTQLLITGGKLKIC